MVYGLLIYAIPTILLLIGVRKFRERSWGSCNNSVKLNNKVAIVTGANCGIGYEIAKELALRNAEIILACRNIDSANQALARIKKNSKKELKMTVMELDLASLKSIKQFALQVQQLHPKIHLLINNAGVSFPRKELHYTQDKFEIHFGVNHLGHFYLTNLLLETLKNSAPSRVIVVSSSLHEKGRLDVDNLLNPQVGTNFYANSKLANIYFSKELAKRTQGTGLNVYAVCPGWVLTSLFRHSIRWYHYVLVAPIAFFFMRSPKQGSQTVIYCATEPSLENESGLIYKDCAEYPSKIKFEESLASSLWEKSENLIRGKSNLSVESIITK